MKIKNLILVTKVLPILLAFVYLINSIISYFTDYSVILGYIGSISVLTIIYLYIASYIFKLCEYYRMFLHYCVLIDVINIFDYYIGIPITDKQLLCLYIILSIITMFIILYMKVFKI